MYTFRVTSACHWVGTLKGTAVAPLDTYLCPCSLYLIEPRLVPLVALLHLNQKLTY